MTALRACQLVAGRAPPHLWPARACLHPAGDVPFRMPHPSISLLLADSKVPKRHRLGTPNGHPLGLNPAGVLLFRMRAHRADPSISLLLADSKVPQRHRLGTPNGHPLGLNPAGVLLFRMRAHRAVTCLSRTGFILPFTIHPTSPTKACLLAS